MSNLNKCRVCLLDGAEIPIFDDVESKESIHSKLFQCFKEKIKDLEGYPRNICKSCNKTLHTVCAFIAKFKTSCELLKSKLTVIKKEVCSDNDSNGNDVDFLKEELNELEVCKKEPHLDDIESLDDTIWNIPLVCVEKPVESLSQIKAKLRSLKEISLKKKTDRRSVRKTGKVASSILEAEFEWNGESFKSNILKEPKKGLVEKIPKVQRKYKELKLPKLTTCPKPSPPSLCDICGEVFKNYTKMMCHKKNKHLIKPVKCPQCPESSHLYTDRNLIRHIKRVHGEKPFSCDTCGKRFAWKGRLSAHITKVHSKLKPSKKFICEKCSKSFTNAKSLLIHERSAHTGLRPAQCSECGARFFHEDYLKEHIRLHTGETPFKCPICGRGYAQRGNMISHITHNHRRKDLSAEQIKMLRPNWFKYLKKP